MDVFAQQQTKYLQQNVSKKETMKHMKIPSFV
jgi:hypothetical protein